jgi:hypothetical protein
VDLVQVKTLRVYMIMSLIMTLFLLLSLVLFEILPLLSGYDDLIVMQQANFQLARDEFMAKDVMILAYRPAAYHYQAINELQTILPQFQRVQVGLLQGDASLGLPGKPPDSVRAALLVTQSDYLAIATAVQRLLMYPDSENPDMIQVEIVLQHERLYTTNMYQVITLLQQDAEARKVQLIFIKLTIIGGAGVIVILKYTLFTRHALRGMAEAEQDNTNKQEEQQ